MRVDSQGFLNFMTLGKDLLIAFDLPETGGKVVNECLRNGLILNSPRPATIRLIPALTVTKEEIDSMLQILTKVLGKLL